MKTMKTVLVVLALTFFGATFASRVQANDWNKKTTITFSEPVEIPGQILPAGTYTLKLVDIASERHVVQFLDESGTHVIATVLAINNWRLKPTGSTVMKFAERTGDNPEAVKAWFYPGDNFGQEFVYPKQRAIELAVAEKEPIPALTVETTPENLKTVPLVAVTPERQEVPVSQAIEVNPETPLVAENTSPAPAAQAKTLPKTAGLVPLIALVGLASLGCAFVVKRFAIQES
jgi:hypothetical protein